MAQQPVKLGNHDISGIFVDGLSFPSGCIFARLLLTMPEMLFTWKSEED